MSIGESTYGTIERCDDNIVDSGKEAHLIDKVSELIGMSPEQEDGHQTTAMECMTNTREHASGHQPSQQGNKNWRFSVYCNQEKNLVQFSFVDFGIGIFVSLERHQIRWLSQIMAKIGSARRSDVLEELLVITQVEIEWLQKNEQALDRIIGDMDYLTLLGVIEINKPAG